MNRTQMVYDLNKQYLQHALGETTLLHDDKLIEPTLAALNVRRNDDPGEAGQPAYVVLDPNGDPISAAISETSKWSPGGSSSPCVIPSSWMR